MESGVLFIAYVRTDEKLFDSTFTTEQNQVCEESNDFGMNILKEVE